MRYVSPSAVANIITVKSLSLLSSCVYFSPRRTLPGVLERKQLELGVKVLGGAKIERSAFTMGKRGPPLAYAILLNSFTFIEQMFLSSLLNCLPIKQYRAKLMELLSTAR